mmetsp:Transcript_29028/g.48785  ORF Transcript_29028/g.48785 Transcript_29028/m.48785 type:complete len:293 (+) Transcript_29028:64-942(+)
MEAAPSSESSSQHIRDFKLAIEFKYLMKHAPAGVYLVPELDDIHRLHGVIFVRRGLYRDGVFRFVMSLPSNYNDINTHPQITFASPIPYNPLIDPDTGCLDLRTDDSIREWQPDKHFIVTAVTFLKRIFYMKSYEACSIIANPDAKKLFETNEDLFLERVRDSVKKSLDGIYETPTISAVGQSMDMLVFTEPKPEHEDLKRRVILREQKQGEEEAMKLEQSQIDGADQDNSRSGNDAGVDPVNSIDTSSTVNNRGSAEKEDDDDDIMTNRNAEEDDEEQREARTSAATADDD